MTIFSPLESVYSSRDSSWSPAPFSSVSRVCVFMAKALSKGCWWNTNSRKVSFAAHPSPASERGTSV